MANILGFAGQQLRKVVEDAFKAALEKGALPAGEIPVFSVEIPNDLSHGDFASNAAMVSAKAFHMAPRKIAEILCQNICLQDTYFDRFEVAGPGFLNFFLSDRWFAKVLLDVEESGENYGRSDYGKGEKVMIEFVSANPTGPMHMGNARGGALGDCLAAVMDCAGFDVTREFYVNDAGNQVEKFGASLEARYLQIYQGEEAVPFPEDGYQGADIIELAQEFAQIHGNRYLNADSKERKEALVSYALPKNIDKLRTDLETYRILYDVWFLESTLHQSGAVEQVIQILKDKGLTYEKEGALWYKASEYGGEKDEVLIRSNGFPTYFTVDIAYHYNKFAVRGFQRVINVWGADHHGHVARLKGSMDAVGLSGDKLDIVLMQMVNLVKDGQPVRMSKRTGKAISLRDLLEEVPIDAARFFFNMREPNSSLDFDLDLAAEQSSQNPVYYVQYAHARICSIFRNLEKEGIVRKSCTEEQLMLLSSPEEKTLIRFLAKLPNEIMDAAKNYDPARITRYTLELATLFHKFYNSCRVKGEEESLLQARLNLCYGVRVTLKNILTLMKITAPETM